MSQGIPNCHHVFVTLQVDKIDAALWGGISDTRADMSPETGKADRFVAVVTLPPPVYI